MDEQLYRPKEKTFSALLIPELCTKWTLRDNLRAGYSAYGLSRNGNHPLSGHLSGLGQSGADVLGFHVLNSNIDGAIDQPFLAEPASMPRAPCTMSFAAVSNTVKSFGRVPIATIFSSGFRRSWVKPKPAVTHGLWCSTILTLIIKKRCDTVYCFGGISP